MLTNWIRFYSSFRLLPLFRKPLAVLVLFRNIIKARLFKMGPVIRGVDIVTTYRCNLVCHHCNIQTMEKDETEKLTLDDYRRLEKECTKMGVVQYTFTGGEPLLCKELEEMLKIFKPFKRVMILQSNATPIKNLSVAQHLRQIGIDIVNVSLDSAIAEEHDANRGVAGHYEKTLHALGLCRKAGLKTMVGTVLTHQNLHADGMKFLFDYARKSKTVCVLNLAAPAGMWHDNKDILLDKEDQKFIRDLCKENPYVRLDLHSAINQYGCPAFKEKLYITPYGDVTGCTFVQISVGNCKEMSLKDIRDKALSLDLMKDFAQTCYCAENTEFIKKYMSQLGEDVPKHYTKVMVGE